MQRLHSLADYKQQAKTLRQELGQDTLSHADALELVAKQQGFRNWNTLHGTLGNRPLAHRLAPDDRVSGRYLGHRFVGTVRSCRAYGDTGHRRLVIRFDEPIDVVTFDSFSSFRRQIGCTVGPDGRSPQLTSDGTPHVVLDG